jgi:hypothetical protein
MFTINAKGYNLYVNMVSRLLTSLVAVTDHLASNFEKNE